MNNVSVVRPVLAPLLAFWMIVGCSPGSPNASTAPGLNSLGSSRLGAHGASGTGDLLYAAADGKSYVLTYPQGKLVGTIAEGASDACSDSAGDVFLTVDQRVDEFMHGATTPSASLALPATGYGCAVDADTGNLAVVFARTSGDDIAIFSSAEGSPTLYNSGLSSFNPGYDNAGNLFVDGTGQSGGVGLAELPKGGSEFTAISIDPAIKTLSERIQWDGTYLTLESGVVRRRLSNPLKLYRLAVSGSTATVVTSTSLKAIRRVAYLSWIYGGTVIVPFGHVHDGSPDIGYWKYPNGGMPKDVLKAPAGRGARINAVTISSGS